MHTAQNYSFSNPDVLHISTRKSVLHRPFACQNILFDTFSLISSLCFHHFWAKIGKNGSKKLYSQTLTHTPTLVKRPKKIYKKMFSTIFKGLVGVSFTVGKHAQSIFLGWNVNVNVCVYVYFSSKFLSTSTFMWILETCMCILKQLIVWIYELCE